MPMMANVLVMTAKINASVGLISLVCCYAGKEATGWGAAAINYALPSFARSFHFALGNKHKVYTLVHARSAATMVYIDFEDMDNRDFVGAKMVQTGKKTDAGVGGWEPQSIGSKYRYYWNNGTQVVSSVYG